MKERIWVIAGSNSARATNLFGFKGQWFDLLMVIELTHFSYSYREY
jgi:hypothetical protein